MKTALRYLAVLYLIALVVLWGFIHFDTGKLWPVTLFLFSPRWAVGLPLLALIPLTVAFESRLILIYILHGLVIAFPIMDCRVAWDQPVPPKAERSLMVMTYNVGGGEVSAERLVALTQLQAVDLLLLQECPSSLSKPVFQQLGWTHRQHGNLAIGSSFELGELQVLATQPPSRYNAVAAVSCELRFSTEASPKFQVEASKPATVRIVNVHFPTFRPALEKATRLDSSVGVAIVDLGYAYNDLVGNAQKQVRGYQVPTVIGGDFNVPVESAFYRSHWSDYQNALSNLGTGLRHTKHTRFHGIRIDHLLADGNWIFELASVGHPLGGDHSPVLVKLSLPD